MIVEATEIAKRLNLVGPIADQCQYSMLVRDNVEQKLKYVFER